MRWWKVLSSPQGNFWARVAVALFMLVFGLVALIYGDAARQILGAGALLIGVVYAATAVGQRHEVRPPEPPADR